MYIVRVIFGNLDLSKKVPTLANNIGNFLWCLIYMGSMKGDPWINFFGIFFQ